MWFLHRDFCKIIEFLQYRISPKKHFIAKNPIDLGTRCTVFMNSKVKQAQKEGASVADISAGLAYSVIKNALFKVIKLSDARDLGENIVVQGGTFYNDAVLRSFEKIAGCPRNPSGYRRNHGCFRSCAHRKRTSSKKATRQACLPSSRSTSFPTQQSLTRCQGCTNHCLLTINKFSDNRQYITGNRCERGLGKEKNKENIPNLFEYKNKRLFDYKPLSAEEADPRNGWYSTCSEHVRELSILGYVLQKARLFRCTVSAVYAERFTSSVSTVSLASLNVTLPNLHMDTLHGSFTRTCDFIFYPAIPYERNEFPDANNHYNCPIVTSYSENIKNNVDEITSGQMRLLKSVYGFYQRRSSLPAAGCLLQERVPYFRIRSPRCGLRRLERIRSYTP